MPLNNAFRIIPGTSNSGNSTAASSLVFTPTPEIASESVQGAIEENREELEGQINEIADEDWEAVFEDSL